MTKVNLDSLCEICALPAIHSPCSERCRQLTPKKRALDSQMVAARQFILSEVRNLKPHTTQCPGLLAEKIMGELGIKVSNARDSLALLRGTYLTLREEKKLRFYQKGEVVSLGKSPKGSFRIGR